MNAFVAVDVETTGLDFETERLIEVAGVRFENGEVVAEFQALLSPAKPLTAVSRLLTGLREEDLRAAPPAAETLRAFLEFAGEFPLVAHNAAFDATFLRRALERESLPPPRGPWLDSLMLARAAWPAWEHHRLDYLAGRLKILRDAEHRALPDARRAGRVFLAAQWDLRAAVSRETWNAIAGLAEELPGWNRVFPPVDGESAWEGVPQHSEVVQSAADVPLETNGGAACGSSIEEASGSLMEKQWLAWETSPRENDLLSGLRVAIQTASKGLRVLFCVPDAGAWDAVRNRLWPGRKENDGLKLAALAEPQGYLCRRRLQEVLKNPGRRLPVEERASAIPLIAWADQTSSSLIADCRGFSPERMRLLWSRLCCDAYDEDPAAQAARVDAENANVILATHATLFSHLRLEGALLPACDTVIFAESHRLPEAARKAFGRDINFFRLHEILKLLPQSQEPEKQLQRFFQKAGKQAAKRRTAGENRIRHAGTVALAFGANPEPVISALKENEAFLLGCNENRAALRLRAFRLDFERLCDARDPGEVFWLEDFSNPHKAALRSAPLGLEADLGSRLRAVFEAGLFISPALTIAGSSPADFFLQSLGMRAAKNEPQIKLLRDSDVHPPKFLLAPFVPVAASMESGVEFAKFLFEAASPFSEKGVFVFIPSMGALRTVHQALRALLPSDSPLWAQHVDGGRDALMKLFASAKGGWVLAIEGMEGLCDVEGRSPALAVVARMPLPSARDPLWAAQGEHIRAVGRNPRHELTHPSAVLRLKRELVPLRRKEGLKVIWLLDARASGEGLGAHAARSLDCEPQTAADLEALQAATRAVLSS